MSTPSAHALLSASSADRWLHCPRSVRFSDGMAEATSPYAEEGTLAHAMGETYLRQKYVDPGMTKRSLTMAINKLKKSEHYAQDMDSAVEAYVDLVDRTVLSFPTKPYVALEIQLDLSEWAPESFGTSDCVVIGGDTLHVIDYKHGKGVQVEAKDNPQIRLYALGAYRRYGMLYNIRQVVMHICQPRLGNMPAEKQSIEELLAWGESIKPTARDAFEGKGDFCAGDWCRWCLAKGVCRHRAFAQLALEEQARKAQADTLTPAEIGDALLRGANLAAWLKDLQDYALGVCLDGGEIPGWKAVEGRSIRKFVDTDEAFKAAIAAGVDEALLYKRQPITLTETEKLLKKKDFDTILGSYVIKPPGAPTLVKEKDARPAIDGRPTAREDFATND